MTFIEMLQQAAAEYEPVEPVVIEPKPHCILCREQSLLNDAGYCADCQEVVHRGYHIAQMAGRCANGAERDAGQLWHAVEFDGHGIEYTAAPAVCNAKPGKRSVGWSNWRPVGRQVTCERCIGRVTQLVEWGSRKAHGGSIQAVTG